MPDSRAHIAPIDPAVFGLILLGSRRQDRTPVMFPQMSPVIANREELNRNDLSAIRPDQFGVRGLKVSLQSIRPTDIDDLDFVVDDAYTSTKLELSGFIFDLPDGRFGCRPRGRRPFHRRTPVRDRPASV